MMLAVKMAEDPDLKGQAFNFSNEIQLTVLDLTLQILNVLGRSDLEPVVLDDAKNEIQHQYLDAEKARRVLGWNPEFSLTAGLERTVAWYQEFLEFRSTRQFSSRGPISFAWPDRKYSSPPFARCARPRKWL
jgi:CDP-glucose 4,6-dehydratase